MQATEALKDILVRSLNAAVVGCEAAQNDWDRAFACMPVEDQANWLLDLFKNLTQAELDSLPKFHKELIHHKEIVTALNAVREG